MLKVLNLYSGIGGNRKLWEGCQVTSVELDPEISNVYKKLFPQDEVVCGDAHDYLEKHFSEYNFIWASPPCPSHGQYRHNVGVLGKGFDPVIPDMKLYGEIIFLQTYFKGKYVVENVKPYYEPLVKPSFELQRHLFWANFEVRNRMFGSSKIRSKNKISDFEGHEVVSDSQISNKRQVMRNCVDPEVGLHIFKSAFGKDDLDDVGEIFV
jgi:DNA (cytosine-5)-methyltransferase 1